MAEPLRIVRPPASPDEALTIEWLVTNGLGGYASGTLCGAATRRYHGLLVAALPSPLGRIMMLNHLSEELRLPDGSKVQLGAIERADERPELPGLPYLEELRLEAGLPVWRWRIGSFVVEKRVWMTHQQNTTWVRYRLLEGDGKLRLKL